MISHQICLFKRRNLMITFLSTCLSGAFILFTYGHIETLNPLGALHFTDTSESILNVSTVPACIHPKLNINDAVSMTFVNKRPAIKCVGEKNWVYVHNGTVRFFEDAVKLHGPISCDYYNAVRSSEDDTSWAKPTRNIKDGFSIESDAFRVVCRGGDNATYENAHSGIAFTKERAGRPRDPLKSGFEGLSIAILGFDSVSRMSWLRRLPKTRKYFHDTLGAIELEGHNVVGDGTTAVMLPMLTGKFEWELPECRKEFKGAATLDKFPFIWKDMKKAGYLTSWANGDPKTATFNYRMLGFKEQPTDFYARTFFLAAKPYWKSSNKLCAGSEPLSQVWLNMFKDIFTTYPQHPKFLIHFIDEFSHDDNNRLTSIDGEVEEAVRFLHDGKYLNNTLLILMGDHGARYGSFRSTWQGKMEERLPYMSFLFPPWFHQKHPDAIKNFRTNSKRLTTPFDLHETFQDFLHSREFGPGNASNRGISLFQEIPHDRTCEQADIAQHWCACLDWQHMSPKDSELTQVLQAGLDTINAFTADFRSDCALLKVDNITMAIKKQTRAAVLKFKSTDPNGGIYKVDLSGNTNDLMSVYQVSFVTAPGGGHFETTVKKDPSNNNYLVDKKEISRINKYGKDSACILDKNKEIRQYCYCNNNIKH